MRPLLHSPRHGPGSWSRRSRCARRAERSPGSPARLRHQIDTQAGRTPGPCTGFYRDPSGQQHRAPPPPRTLRFKTEQWGGFPRPAPAQPPQVTGPHPSEGQSRARDQKKVPLPDGPACEPGQPRERSRTRRRRHPRPERRAPSRSPQPGSSISEAGDRDAGSVEGRRRGQFSFALPLPPHPFPSRRQPGRPAPEDARAAAQPLPPPARARLPRPGRPPAPQPLPEPEMCTRRGRPLLEQDDRSLWERPRGLGSPGSLCRGRGGADASDPEALAATCPTGSPGGSAGLRPVSAIGSSGGWPGARGGAGAEGSAAGSAAGRAEPRPPGRARGREAGRRAPRSWAAGREEEEERKVCTGRSRLQPALAPAGASRRARSRPPSGPANLPGCSSPRGRALPSAGWRR